MHRKVGKKGRGMPGMRPGSAKNHNKGGARFGMGTGKPQVTKARPRKHIANKSVISAMRKG